MKHSFRTWYLGITTIFALLALTAATYAWFTSNREVQTNTASARTGEETLELQISSNGGNNFTTMETAVISQVNQTDASYLLPVSTADLENFVYSPFTEDGKASVFRKVENEEYYYHGRIYLRAAGTGWSEGSRMDLYLDQTDGVLGENVSGQLLHAARLGMIFDNNPASRVIFRMSEEENPQSQQTYNTVINGTTLGKDQVLSYQDGSVVPTADPAVSMDTYTVRLGESDLTLPEKKLLTMEFNRIYPVDIYFYLEGCDPDCSDDLSFHLADLHLAFYGVLTQEETG